MADRKFINGLYFRRKHPKSPDFVIGKGAIDPERLRAFLDENPLPEGEKYINFQILWVKNSPDKGTFVVDDWKPEKKEVNTEEQQRKFEEKQEKERRSQEELNALYGDSINPEDIPF